MSSRSVRKVFCDFCETTTICDEIDEPEGWFQVFRDGYYLDFCSPECICKQYQPAADVLVPDYPF